MTGGPVPDSPAPVVIRERAVLRKFDGDDQTKPPVEVLLIEDGRVTGRWTDQEVADAPTE